MNAKRSYKVSNVEKRWVPKDGYNVTLVDPEQRDEDGEEKYIGGFAYEGDGLPPVLGEMVEVEGALGSTNCTVEWKHGRFAMTDQGTKYEAKP